MSILLFKKIYKTFGWQLVISVRNIVIVALSYSYR